MKTVYLVLTRPYNRPGIILLDKITNNAYVLDAAILLNINIRNAYLEKI